MRSEQYERLVLSNEETFPLFKNMGEDLGYLRPYVTVVLPAFNEETRIGKTLLKWGEFLDKYYCEDYELFVVMDGCTDKTVDIVYALSGNGKRIVPLVYGERLGKGGALIEAVKYSRGKIFFFTDADGSLHPTEFSKFVKTIESGYDLVVGGRYFRGSSFVVSLPLNRLMFSRVFNALLKLIFPELKGIYDTQCGAKAGSREVVEKMGEDLFITDFAFDVNLIYSALHDGFRVREIRVRYDHVENDSKVSRKLWQTSLAMFFSVARLRVHYSRFRCFLYSEWIKKLGEFFVKVVP
jgi:glycosyltransferase involved in cell wall biosynthesis